MGPALTREPTPSAEDAHILRSRTVRPGAPPEKHSRFGDMVWHLAPAHPDAHPKINAVRWEHWPAELVAEFKIVTLAFLECPTPGSVTVGSDGDLMGIGTLSLRLRTLRIFALWMNQQDLHQLCEVTDEHLEHYYRHVIALQTSNRYKSELLAAVRTVWIYQAHLPPRCRLATTNPWGGASVKRLANAPGRAWGQENTTPRIAPATMEPLLAWSLRMVETIGPDIVTARRELDQLEAGTHPAQRPFQGPPSRRRVELFVARATDTGGALPGHPPQGQDRRINWRQLALLLDLPHHRFPPSLRPLVLHSGLPIAAGSPLGMITGYIDGRPWRDGPITVHELPGLVSHLAAACFVAISYLSGMRPGEVLNLRLGCSRRDESTGQFLVTGRYGKATARTPRPDVGQDTWGRSWVVVQPVHAAITLLEELSDSPFLFPASLTRAHTIRPASQHARRSEEMTRDLDNLFAWLNATFQRADGQPVVPADPTCRIHPSRFRRTLAYFIVRRPRGLIAAALQYGHVSTAVTLSYAGKPDTGWLDDLAVERLEFIIEQNEQDYTLLQAGEHVSGPSAAEYRDRLEQTHRFAGRVINRVRNVERLLQQADSSIHHGHGMTCVWRAESAACRNTRITEGLPADDAPIEAECQSGCQNLAYTDRDITRLRERLATLEAAAADALAPSPLRDRAHAQADRVRTILEQHGATSTAETTP
jgi:integrase